ncbi:MAG: SpoIIE family protein phosphatase [Candidatus Aquicultor sp.]
MPGAKSYRRRQNLSHRGGCFYPQRREALRESEARLRTLVEQIPAVTYIAALDPASTTLYVSPQIKEILGYSEAEFMSDPDFWRKHLYPDDYSRVMDDLAVSHAASAPFITEYRMFTGDGSVRWVRDEAVVVRDDTGKPLVLQGVMFDITESKRAKELSDALNRVSVAINSTLEFSEIMQSVVVESTRAIGCESAAVILREDDYWVARYVFGFPQDIIGRKLTGEQIPIVPIAASKKETLVSNDALHDRRVNGNTAKRYNVRSLMTVPLLLRDEVIGAITFYYHSAPVTFDHTQIDFAGKLASSVSLALENARLYSAQRHIADILQESLLTMPERIEGMTFGYLYRSASEAARIGGDFYDLFEIEHGKIGIIIGDVSGKGIEAAALTSMVRNTIKAHAYEGGTPALIMAKANDMLVKTSPPNIFMTAFFGVLELDTGKLTYCSAGHPPAMIKRGPHVQLLAKNSPMIGGFPGMHYRSGKANLKKGDILLLYTDGIIEARDNGEFFGEQRLVDLLKDLQPMPAKEVPGALFDHVMEFTDGELSDDVAILVVSPEK